MVSLKIKDDTGERTFELTKATISIGRSQENEVQIKTEQSSRRHCAIEQGEWGYKLVDLESRNGTKVNGRVVNQHLLNHGDRIEIGSATLEFVAPGLTPAPAPVSVPLAAGMTGLTVPMASPPKPDDIKIISAPPARMGPRRPGSTVQGMSPEERAALDKRLREQAIVKWFTIGGGLLLALIIGYLVISSITAKSPQVLAAEARLNEAKAMMAANPSGAIEKLKQIPPEASDAYREAQALIKELEEKVHGVEITELSDMEKAYRVVDEFSQKYPDKFDEITKRVDEFETKFKDQLTPVYQNGVESLRQRVRNGRVAKREENLRALEEEVNDRIKRHEYGQAMKKVAQKRALFSADPAATEKVNAAEKRVLEAGSHYFDEQKAEAERLIKDGKKPEAQILYENLIECFRDPVFDDLLKAIRTLLNNLKP